MSLDLIAQAFQIVVCIALLGRLASLPKEGVYRSFGLFLVVDLLGSLYWLCIEYRLTNSDYRVVFGIHRIIVQILSFTTIYFLLKRILAPYPGVLGWGMKRLQWSFLIALGIGVLSLGWQLEKAGQYRTELSWEAMFVQQVFLGERVASSVALLWVLGMFFFLLVVPISVPKNVAVFLSSLVAYSVGETVTELALSLHVHQLTDKLSAIMGAWAGICFLYCAVNLNQAGQHVPRILSRRTSPEERHRLIGALEQLNASLLRSANREA